MNIFDYDDESDSLYVHISSKKAFYTLEVSERVGVDFCASLRSWRSYFCNQQLYNLCPIW